MLQNVGNSYSTGKFIDFSLILALQCPASWASTFPMYRTKDSFIYSSVNKVILDRTQKYFGITLIISIENELEAFPIKIYRMKPLMYIPR